MHNLSSFSDFNKNPLQHYNPYLFSKTDLPNRRTLAAVALFNTFSATSSLVVLSLRGVHLLSHKCFHLIKPDHFAEHLIHQKISANYDSLKQAGAGSLWSLFAFIHCDLAIWKLRQRTINNCITEILTASLEENLLRDNPHEIGVRQNKKILKLTTILPSLSDDQIVWFGQQLATCLPHLIRERVFLSLNSLLVNQLVRQDLKPETKKKIYKMAQEGISSYYQTRPFRSLLAATQEINPVEYVKITDQERNRTPSKIKNAWKAGNPTNYSQHTKQREILKRQIQIIESLEYRDNSLFFKFLSCLPKIDYSLSPEQKAQFNEIKKKINNELKKEPSFIGKFKQVCQDLSGVTDSDTIKSMLSDRDIINNPRKLIKFFDFAANHNKSWASSHSPVLEVVFDCVEQHIKDEKLRDPELISLAIKTSESCLDASKTQVKCQVQDVELSMNRLRFYSLDYLRALTHFNELDPSDVNLEEVDINEFYIMSFTDGLTPIPLNLNEEEMVEFLDKAAMHSYPPSFFAEFLNSMDVSIERTISSCTPYRLTRNTFSIFPIPEEDEYAQTAVQRLNTFLTHPHIQNLMEEGKLICNRAWQLHDDEAMRNQENLQVEKLELLQTSLTTKELTEWSHSWPLIKELTLKLPIDIDSFREGLIGFHNLKQVVLVYENEADRLDAEEFNKLQETADMPTLIMRHVNENIRNRV